MGLEQAGDKALSLLGETIAGERTRLVDYILRCRAAGYIAFDDDPFEIVSPFVAMAGANGRCGSAPGCSPNSPTR